jgi:TPR repeat protein
LAGGDVAAARAFLERAADAGDARALLVLGDAYDPATLTRLGAVGLKGDPSRARDYYQRASDAGLAAARQRIAAAEASQ